MDNLQSRVGPVKPILLAMNNVEERTWVGNCINKGNFFVVNVYDLATLASELAKNESMVLVIDHNFEGYSIVSYLENIAQQRSENVIGILLLVSRPHIPELPPKLLSLKTQWTHKPFYCQEIHERLAKF